LVFGVIVSQSKKRQTAFVPEPQTAA